jgi:hypothetical protein
VEDLRNIRMLGSQSDYDGDGNLDEGISAEIQGLQEQLYAGIQSYASNVAGSGIQYDAATYPYWFGEGEISGDNGFAAWTPRLLKAAYNYQVSIKDPGAFAHNAKYVIQLLYDSLADLNAGNEANAIDMGTMVRNDPGHFDGTAEAFRHWDEEGLVAIDCVRCHTADGLPLFISQALASRDQVTGATVSLEPSNGLSCTTCHAEMSTFARYQVPAVRFPSGAVLSFAAEGETNDANLCIECHQGRESNVSVQAAIKRAAVDNADTPSESLAFRNPHYFAAGATLFGGEAAGAFQYEGKEYVGRFMHVANFDTCVGCHNAHQLTLNFQACQGCHQGVESPEEIRFGNSMGVDFDGDGDGNEGLALEVQTAHEKLYAAIQAYGTEAGAPIMFDGSRYPYWFGDVNVNNAIDEGEGAYAAWTPRLLGAAYNYTWVAKDPGSFAHNGMYILQILFDSLEDVGGDTAGMTRPTSQ